MNLDIWMFLGRIDAFQTEGTRQTVTYDGASSTPWWRQVMVGASVNR